MIAAPRIQPDSPSEELPREASGSRIVAITAPPSHRLPPIFRAMPRLAIA